MHLTKALSIAALQGLQESEQIAVHKLELTESVLTDPVPSDTVRTPHIRVVRWETLKL